VIGAVALKDGEPSLEAPCQALHWTLGRVEGETRLRALFVCQAHGVSRRSYRVPLRLRARIGDGCSRMKGSFDLRRLGATIRFRATLAIDGCAADTDCGLDAYCAKPLGECAARGTCTPRPQTCPDVVLPVCGCDGVTYGNACEAAIAGASVSHDGTCSECASNEQCAEGAYCAKPLGRCEARGECVPRPTACPDVVAPVCGCDGVTYSNACDAEAAGTSIAAEGECPPVCGGLGGIQCAETEFCDVPAGFCGVLDLGGRCVPVTPACPEFYQPVCGCDGVTYANDCFRQAARAQKDHDGACGSCTSLADCLPNEYCQAPDGECTERGHCTPIPQVCPGDYDPVCGCDGATHTNRCEAEAKAISIAHAGTCDAVCAGIAGIPCPEGQICDLAAGMCGVSDVQGRCVSIGDGCPTVYDPVCGCDGTTYSSDCVRQKAGAQKSHDGACASAASR
jgi:hypothetical protein